ncbi:MAG: 16S rRNA (cytidine(1402)-2'-O)-methyltransferase [Desulfuromonas sp.]|uniref:16S rRNA (cytidine(1402)-2'-O)-methyltransferase n=1 Tax=Desulfuromonas sp. TaxID=892 RepID=UPI000CA8984D|nr:16S rRNA (cytidine(1402)-2'-O)-methyltransferase [Desulfuromonas sp.]PLX81642.1 MAG: 16S rRNA (cytidine(1402)-2'-O)-methyltransferase [Desulfuromonas sp.]
MPGTLYLVATPIGNLEDFTFRALRILKEVGLVAAEDTRHSRKLFSHYGIDTPLTPFHEHNERQKGERLLVRLQAGEDVALISDAGTPLVADPGFDLVRRCCAEGIAVTAIPGPVAAVVALSLSGLPSDRFAFENFLPAKAGARMRCIEELKGERRTLVFYEAPHRLAVTLRDLASVFGSEREAAVARELTKLHEELARASLGELAERYAAEKPRGEIVLVVAGAPETPPADESEVRSVLRELLAGGMKPRQAVKDVAKRYGLPGDEVYRMALEMKGESG